LAGLTAPGRPSAFVPIQDISRGGIAVACDWRLPAGTEVTIRLANAGGPIGARIVRGDGKGLGLVFQQDAETVARVDRALTRFTPVCRPA
jgi:methyl-accepting chemotaxis protein